MAAGPGGAAGSATAAPGPSARAFVGLGANLGDARATLERAAEQLRALPGVSAMRLSPRYRSAPWQAEGPPFVNAVAELRTSLSPAALLQALLALEADHGRERPYRHAPRTLDLDLLLHGDAVIDDPAGTPALQLPHPRLHERAFVLRPLLDLDASLAHPRLGPLAQWWPAVADQPLERLAD